MAGHSKWANIRHRKGRQDAKRSKIWSKCSRAIIVAAKNGGGDPDANLTLRYAIDDAKSHNMPKDTIQKAIDKGAGGGDGDAYEEIVYEGYGPNGVAVMLEILTDNRNRTAGEIRKLFEKAGGNLGASGSVAFVFNRRGIISLPLDAGSEEQMMDLAVEVGGDDIESDGETWTLTTDVDSYSGARAALTERGIEPLSAGLEMIPEQTVACTGSDAEKVMRFIDQLDDHDDIQKVHANFDIAEEELAAMEG